MGKSITIPIFETKTQIAKMKKKKKRETIQIELQIWSTHQSLMNVQSWHMCHATIMLSKERNRLNTITSKKHKSHINTTINTIITTITTTTTITTMWLNRSIQKHHHRHHKENTLEIWTKFKKHNQVQAIKFKPNSHNIMSLKDGILYKENKLYATYTRKMRRNKIDENEN